MSASCDIYILGNSFDIFSFSSVNNIEDRSEDESEEEVAAARRNIVQNTTRLVESDINYTTRQAAGMAHGSDQQKSIVPVIEKRALGPDGFSLREKCRLRNNLLPDKPEKFHNYNHKVFCGLFSKDGKYFVAATQNSRLHVYGIYKNTFNPNVFREIEARDVGWSILDVAFSPNNRHIVYSSWSESLYQCSLEHRNVTLEKLELSPRNRRFCVFSTVFSNNGREIFCGANDEHLHVYDRESQQQVLRAHCHDKDINTIAFADESSFIFYTGSDDGMCKIWDRRDLNQNNPRTVGVLAGHSNGITYIDSRGDGRYLISNSKDQSIKLWDIRSPCSNRTYEQNAREQVNRQEWDYRWQRMPSGITEPLFIQGDSSIMTYYGHCVRKTLIRCRFSPAITTGQRYIYTGDSRGRLITYDLLTGKIVLDIRAHRGCVRDVCWHPYNHDIYTSSWDGKVVKWSYRDDSNVNGQEIKLATTYAPQLRRSERIAEQRRANS